LCITQENKGSDISVFFCVREIIKKSVWCFLGSGVVRFVRNIKADVDRPRSTGIKKYGFAFAVKKVRIGQETKKLYQDLE